MKPFEQYLFQRKYGMTSRKNLILDMLGAQATAMDLIDFCATMEVASQATLHREIHEMIDAGFILSRTPAKDRRLVILKLSKKGRDYLKKL